MGKRWTLAGLAALAIAGPAWADGKVQGPGLAPNIATLPPQPEPVKRAPVNGVLVLYGNEQCPTDTNGNEIVICERRSAQEQYRVPKELREFTVTPQNQSWAKRAVGVEEAGGATGIGSCTAVGPGGSTGCFNQQVKAAKAENEEQAKIDRNVP